MIRIGLLIVCVLFSYLQLLSQIESGDLEFFGEVTLVKEITSEGDTIFENNINKKVEIITIQHFNDGKTSKVENLFNHNDSLYHYFQFNTKYTIYYSCKGYNTKGLSVNTYNIPEVSEYYENGYEFPA